MNLIFDLSGPRLLIRSVAVRGLRLRAVGDLWSIGDADPQPGGRPTSDNADVARLQRCPALLQQGGRRAQHLQLMVPPSTLSMTSEHPPSPSTSTASTSLAPKCPRRVLLLQVWGVHAAP